jgi:hypothetical protein
MMEMNPSEIAALRSSLESSRAELAEAKKENESLRERVEKDVREAFYAGWASYDIDGSAKQSLANFLKSKEHP